MSNKLKEIKIKYHACYFLMINTKYHGTNKVTINYGLLLKEAIEVNL